MTSESQEVLALQIGFFRSVSCPLVLLPGGVFCSMRFSFTPTLGWFPKSRTHARTGHRERARRQRGRGRRASSRSSRGGCAWLPALRTHHARPAHPGYPQEFVSKAVVVCARVRGQGRRRGVGQDGSVEWRGEGAGLEFNSIQFPRHGGGAGTGELKCATRWLSWHLRSFFGCVRVRGWQ